jgi:hypothetical protein
MGKCSKCGKRIEYNNFVVVDGIVYHKECAPKKEADQEVVKAELEAEERFEKDMAEVGQTVEELKEEVAEQIAKEEKKPRKKRVKK